MKNIFQLTGVIVALLLCCGSGGVQEKYPGTVISNGVITASLYHPDPQNGFYRGSRFDWSGVISSLKYKDHDYFGQWFFGDHDPVVHDAIAGPVDEFLPPGFQNIKPGGKFLRIGIGMLLKPDEKDYNISTRYAIVNPGKWSFEKINNGIVYRHELADTGYSYRYIKRLELPAGKSQLVIKYELRNTGTRLIETRSYNHNFFVIDGQPTGPDITISFPFSLSGTGRGDSVLGRINGNRIEYLRQLNKGENLYYGDLKGYKNSRDDYDISIENSKTKAGVKITSDQPLAKLVYWSAPKTVCPEPYINISVEPGKVFTWTYTYTFYETTPPNAIKMISR